MVAVAWSRGLWAQRVSIDAALHTTEKPYIVATGEATVSAKPDQAIIEIGVVTQAANVMAVAAQNAKQTDSELADMRRLLIGSNQPRTTTYSVRPSYQNPKPGASAAITGYIATNIVEVTVDDLAQVAKVIDSATQSGANLIQKLQYRLKNPQTVQTLALREASEHAKSNADAIAAGLGMKVVRVLSAEQVTSEDGSVMYQKRAMQPAIGSTPTTPVEVGMIEVDATVTIHVEIGQ
jgi:uncharacterized protein YggE